jgi:hypothetical protein
VVATSGYADHVRRLGLVIALSAALAIELGLLGRDHHHPVAGPDARAEQTPAERGLTLLDYWTQELVPSVLLQRALADALHEHRLARAARLERRMRRGLLRVRGFGPAAAHELPPVRDTGAAWSEWAAALLRPSPRALDVARLERKAVRLHQAAYAAVDATILRAARSP